MANTVAEAPENTQEIMDEENYEPTYELKDIKAKQTMQVWSMLTKVQNSDHIRAAAATSDQGAITMAALRSLLDEVEEEIVPFMVSLTKEYDSYKEKYAHVEVPKLSQIADEKGVSVKDTETKADIAHKLACDEFFENEPGEAPFVLLEDLAHHDPFVRVLSSALRSGKVVKKLIGNLQIGSNSTSDAQTTS